MPSHKQIIVEDVSNPGKQDEVVPTIGDSRDRDEEEDEEEGQEEMKEEEGWNPFGYRRLQDLPVREHDCAVTGQFLRRRDCTDNHTNDRGRSSLPRCWPTGRIRPTLTTLTPGSR